MAITVNQIAEQCGVSRTTVLRALNGGSVSKDTKERILQVAKDNNYRPNLLARSLNHGRTMSLGVVTINIENMYFVQSLNTINKEADKRGYFTNIVVCDDSLEWEKKLIKGYEKILFICPPLEMKEVKNTYTHEQRELGFRNAMGMYPDVNMHVIGKNEFLQEVQTVCKNNLDKRTAFLCSGDSYALMIMQWAAKEGYEIPKDFGLMGFDDISVLQYISPKLTTVSTNVEGVASTAVVELIQQIESEVYSPKSIYLNHKILDRDTL